MSFTRLLNKTLTVTGYTQTGTDGGGQPIFTEAEKGTVRGRVDHRVHAEQVNGPDLNPVISDYLAITALPDGFEITERDYVADEDGAYEVLGVASPDDAHSAHHLELTLRKVTP